MIPTRALLYIAASYFILTGCGKKPAADGGVGGSADPIVGTWQINGQDVLIVQAGGLTMPSDMKLERRKKKVNACKAAGFDVGLKAKGSWTKSDQKYSFNSHMLTKTMQSGKVSSCTYAADHVVGILKSEQLTIMDNGKTLAKLKRKR